MTLPPVLAGAGCCYWGLGLFTLQTCFQVWKHQNLCQPGQRRRLRLLDVEVKTEIVGTAPQETSLPPPYGQMLWASWNAFPIPLSSSLFAYICLAPHSVPWPIFWILEP